MRVGVPKETKNQEYRVGLVPASVKELTLRGHTVVVETGAGQAIGFEDAAYQAAGAQILPTAHEVFAGADLIVKVKEPQLPEMPLLRPDHVLFTYLHLAAAPAIAQGVLDAGCIGIAYETVTDAQGGLPLLAPMSMVAGRLAIQQGTYLLEKHHGGQGLLLGGVPGVAPAKVVVIGGGKVGTQAALMAVGLQADVTIFDASVHRLGELALLFGPSAKTLYMTQDALATALKDADLVVGSVLIPGDAAPKLITRQHVATMKPGAVFVDVAIDQGGCAETSRPTTHDEPTYVVDGVVHYCVTNMPSAVARTSAQALNNATLPFVLALADKGIDALRTNPHLLKGVNTVRGVLTCAEVAHALGQPYTPPLTALETMA